MRTEPTSATPTADPDSDSADPACLEDVANDLLAARKDASAVCSEDFAEALQKITLGPARNILLNPADRARTAFHEAGTRCWYQPATRFIACRLCRAAWRWDRPINCLSTIEPAMRRTISRRVSRAHQIGRVREVSGDVTPYARDVMPDGQRSSCGSSPVNRSVPHDESGIGLSA